MPCKPFKGGFLCAGNKPLSITHRGRTYLFEWTVASGWCPVNADGSGRLSPVPNVVWNLFLGSSICKEWEKKHDPK